MDLHTLDITPLERAIERLSEGWARYQQDVRDTQIRDGLIQRFEFTYDISHKMLKRPLQCLSATPAQYDELSFADLIRAGNQHDLLLGTWPDWRRYRDLRARTSHMDAEAVALDVVAGIPPFLEEARHLRDRIQARKR